jgi:DNA polymerase
MADPAKHRLNLWLKSEQAFGVPSVPRVELPEMEASAARPSRVESAPEVMAAALRPTPPAPAPAAPQASSSVNVPLTLLDMPFESPVMSRVDKIAALAALDRGSVKGCTKCGLSRTRTQTVFGEGDPDAPICFVGEGPGKDEDASGRPFVGRAGQKLDEMIRAMGLRREQVYICNIVKCRAYLPDIGKDRPPSEEETGACTPYLIRQLEVIRPKVIVTLGLPSTRYLLKSNLSMTKMRGNWHAWRGIKVMPTWHPAYVLRNYTAQTRREVWEDLKKVLVEVGLPIPNRSGKSE